MGNQKTSCKCENILLSPLDATFLVKPTVIQSKGKQSEGRSAGVNQPEESQIAATTLSC